MNARSSKKHTLTLAFALSVNSSVHAGAAAADRTAPPKLGEVKPFTLPTPNAITLKNGLKVLHIERTRAPLIDVVANIEAGISADPEALPGVASWTSAMLVEGAGDATKSWDALAFAEAQADLGASITSGAGVDAAALTLHVTATRFNAAMELFAAALTKPRVDDADWKRVKQNLMGGFLLESQDPAALASLAAARVGWGASHRFGTDSQGTPRALKAATRDDVVAFHKAHYRPDTTVLIVVGAIDKATLTKVLEQTLGGWSADGARPATPKLAGPVSMSKRTVVGVLVPDAPQTVLRVVSPAPSGTLPFTADADVMNTLLGGSFTSRLNNNLREQHGYSYGAGSRVVVTRHGAIFSVRTSVAAPVTIPALGEIENELARIHEPASDDEVTRAKNLAALSYPSTFDSGRGTANEFSELLTLGVDKARVEGFLKDATAMDAKGVSSAAKRLVNFDHATIIAVGDVDKLKGELARFGEVRMMTAEELLPGLADSMAQSN